MLTCDLNIHNFCGISIESNKTTNLLAKKSICDIEFIVWYFYSFYYAYMRIFVVIIYAYIQSLLSGGKSLADIVEFLSKITWSQFILYSLFHLKKYEVMKLNKVQKSTLSGAV